MSSIDKDGIESLDSRNKVAQAQGILNDLLNRLKGNSMSGGMEDWADDEIQQRHRQQAELNALRESLTHPTHYGDWVVGEFIHERNMNFFQGNVIKYVDRYKKKDGLRDLKKAIDYLNKLIELEYGEKKT